MMVKRYMRVWGFCVFCLSVVPFLFQSCVWPQRRYQTVRRPTTVAEFYKKKGIDPKRLNKDAIALNKVLKQGEKVYVPFELAQREKKHKKRQLAQETQKGQKKLYWPIYGALITSYYGYRWNRFHEGVDLAGPAGSPIFSADSGVVVYSDNVIKGYGNMIVIKHSKNMSTVYAHNRRNLVEKGQFVKKGQRIAILGDSGETKGHHLHFEVRLNNKPVDPMLYLKPRKKKSWAEIAAEKYFNKY